MYEVVDAEFLQKNFKKLCSPIVELNSDEYLIFDKI